MATNSWTAAAAGTWSTAGNWSLGHAPTIGETVRFGDAYSNKNCTVDVDPPALSYVTFNTYTGIFNDGGRTFSTTNASFGLISSSPGGNHVFSGTWTLAGPLEPNFTSGAVTLGGTWSPSSITMIPSGTCTIACTANLTSGGSVMVNTACTITGALTVTNTATITSNGGTFAAVTVNASGKTVTLADALIASSITGTAGTIAFAGKAVTTSGDVNIVAATGITGAWNVGGDLTMAGAATFAATATIAGLATFTGGTVVSLGGNLTCAGLLSSTSGTFADGGHNITSSGNVNFTSAGAPVTMSGTLRLTGAGTSIIFANTVPAPTTNISGLTVRLSANAGLNIVPGAGGGSRTISRLIVDNGVTATWTAGTYVLAITNYTATNWDNSTWVSSTPGTPYHISAPASVTVASLDVTDCHNTGTEVEASDGTSTDGGGNEGFDFGSAIVPMAMHHYRRLHA